MEKMSATSTPQKDFCSKVFVEIVFVLFYFFVCLFAFHYFFLHGFSRPSETLKGALGTSLECSIAERETPLK